MSQIFHINDDCSSTIRSSADIATISKDWYFLSFVVVTSYKRSSFSPRFIDGTDNHLGPAFVDLANTTIDSEIRVLGALACHLLYVCFWSKIHSYSTQSYFLLCDQSLPNSLIVLTHTLISDLVNRLYGSHPFSHLLRAFTLGLCS